MNDLDDTLENESVEEPATEEAEEIAEQEAVTEEPTVEEEAEEVAEQEPAVDEPVVEEPVTEEADEIVEQEPATEEPAVEPEVTEETELEEEAEEKPEEETEQEPEVTVEEEPEPEVVAVEEPATEEPAVEEETEEKPEEVTEEEPATEEPAVEPEPEATVEEEVEPEVTTEEAIEETSSEPATQEPDEAEVVGEEVTTEEELVYEFEDNSRKSKTRGPYDRPGKWYVVSITSGQEKLAKSNLETRIQTMGVEEKIFEVSIPLEEQVEFKGTKKEVVQKKIFPGYILVRCYLDDETWHVIRNTPSITGFIGAGTKPIPLSRTEVESFLGEKEKEDGTQAVKKIRPRFRYEVGESVKVKEGPFTDFQGEVIEINEDQLKVKLLLNIFGRETPVELEFSQVAKQ